MNTHTRSGSLINGKRVNSRALRQKTGNSRKETIAKLGGEVEVEEPKIRYFFFRGKAKRAHRRAIAHILQPYPKRASEGSTVTRPGSTGESSVRSTDDAPTSTQPALQ